MSSNCLRTHPGCVKWIPEQGRRGERGEGREKEREGEGYKGSPEKAPRAPVVTSS